MKKSKLFIPLTGIAGAAAVAAPICMVSCGDSGIALTLEKDGTSGYQKSGVSVKKNTNYKLTINYDAGFCSNDFFGFYIMSSDHSTTYIDKVDTISGKDGTGDMTFESQTSIYKTTFHNHDQKQTITINVKFKEDIEDVLFYAFMNE